MTTNSEASFSHRVAGPLGSERLAMPWLLVGVVFVGAILMRQFVPLNTDVSWLLVVSERMLDGQHLYRDIIEINPPMAAFAYLPGVALARFLGVDPRHVIDAQLLLLAAVSLLSMWRILLLSSALAKMNWGALAGWAAAVLTILPMHVFGQREHIATLTFLPGLAVYALRGNRDRVPIWAVLIAGGGVGITLIFKPFFVIPAALCIVSSAVRSRSWRVLFSPENIIAGVLVSLASLGTYIFFPEYFSVTYPLVRDTYLSWSMPASAVFLNDASLIFGIAIAAAILRRRDGRPDALLLSAVLASAGFAFSFYLQRRGWAYHSYPMVALAMLAMGYGFMVQADTGSRSRPFCVAAALVSIATFILGCQWFNATVYVGPIREAIVSLKPHPQILVLSGEAAIGHPLVRDIGGVWVSRQENLWIREFVRLTRERTSLDAAGDAKLNEYLALERNWLVADFKKLPPDIVLIDNLRDGWGDWARADAELSQLLRPYSLVRSVEGIDILRKTN